jgi:hypothetical protein
MAQERRRKRNITWRAASPPSAYSRLYKPLGYIVVTFADMEQMLTFAIAEHLPKSGAAALALEWLMQNLNNRIQLFYFLAQEWISESVKNDPEHKSDFESLRPILQGIFESLGQANSDRNNLLHSPWSGMGIGKLRTYSKERHKAEGGILSEIPLKGITPNLLAEQAKYFISIRIRLWDWLLRVNYDRGPEHWPEPLPDKYFLPSPLQNLILVNKGKTPRGPRQSSRP